MVAPVVAGTDVSQQSASASIRWFGRILGHGLVSVILIILGGWTVCHNWPLRSIRFDELEYSEQAAKRLAGYPGAQYAYGMWAWNDQQPAKAATFFRTAVSQDVLLIDAWLRLAEAEAALGQEANARGILDFVSRLTDHVLRWKWPEMVLARQLGLNERFFQNANDLLAHQTGVQDTLQLLHTQVDGEASAVCAVLAPENLSAYLVWLMHWGMAEESLTVWQAMIAFSQPEKPLALRYANFLLGHKRVIQAIDIWQQYTGMSGITNPGFEESITGIGFDWRQGDEDVSNWELKRVHTDSAEGSFSLQIKFNGQANLSFQHLYQIVAISPDTRYRLTYAWKTRGITTDQGPFVEIIGYDTPKHAPGLHATGTMMSGTHGWQDDAIDFTVPGDCRAVVVRLRRKTSMRFDSKIQGRVWLDHFRLEEIYTDLQHINIEDKLQKFSTDPEVSN